VESRGPQRSPSPATPPPFTSPFTIHSSLFPPRPFIQFSLPVIPPLLSAEHLRRQEQRPGSAAKDVFAFVLHYPLSTIHYELCLAAFGTFWHLVALQATFRSATAAGPNSLTTFPTNTNTSTSPPANGTSGATSGAFPVKKSTANESFARTWSSRCVSSCKSRLRILPRIRRLPLPHFFWTPNPDPVRHCAAVALASLSSGLATDTAGRFITCV